MKGYFFIVFLISAFAHKFSYAEDRITWNIYKDGRTKGSFFTQIKKNEDGCEYSYKILDDSDTDNALISNNEIVTVVNTAFCGASLQTHTTGMHALGTDLLQQLYLAINFTSTGSDTPSIPSQLPSSVVVPSFPIAIIPGAAVLLQSMSAGPIENYSHGSHSAVFTNMCVFNHDDSTSQESGVALIHINGNYHAILANGGLNSNNIESIISLFANDQHNFEVAENLPEIFYEAVIQPSLFHPQLNTMEAYQHGYTVNEATIEFMQEAKFLSSE